MTASLPPANVLASVPGRDLPPTTRVRDAFRRLRAADRPEVWTALRAEDDVLADARAVERRGDAGEHLPCAGLLVAVKDNVDVHGLPTTAGCPSYAYRPRRTATAVARLLDAGALVLGKTNLDQFATGLVGTRSPYGAVGSVHDPRRVAGGSSSGSAVAVGLGIADVGIATDTAGSGRVPAAFNGVVGLKASPGIVPASGVVPACADYDCVSVIAADLPVARAALAVMAGPDTADPRSRPYPPDLRLAAGAVPRVAVPRDEDLVTLAPAFRAAFDATVARARTLGWRCDVLDVSAMLDVATLLYDGAIVAERHAAVGAFLDAAPEDADPTVTAIVRTAAAVGGPTFAADLDEIARLRARAHTVLAGFDGLLMPVTTEHPTIAEVVDEPVAINRRLGTYTNFANLLDLAAMAVPGVPTADGPFGVMVLAPFPHDHVALDLAARLTGSGAGPLLTDAVHPLLVVGAHLRGEPLCGDLEALGARFVGEAATSDAYRMVALATTPPKPGLVRHGAGHGARLPGELWELPESALGRLLADLAPPMGLAPVELADGRWVVGFTCSADAAEQGADITSSGGWRAHRRDAG